VHGRGLTHGRTGNVSARVGDQVVVTPTGASLSTVTESELAVIGLDGTVREGKPSKETGLHLAVYRSRPTARAVVHTHSLYSAAVSCIPTVDEDDALPPLTAYYRMRVGRLPVVPFAPPGDRQLAVHAGRAARDAHCMLLRNHGAVVAGDDLDHALDVLEELEHVAQLYLLLGERAAPPADRHDG